MKISFCKLSLATVLFFATNAFCDSPQAEQATKDTTSQANNQKQVNQPQDLDLDEIKSVVAQFMDSLVTKAIRQIERIEELLQDLSLSVNNNSIGGENKEILIKQIKDIRAIIDSIKREAFVNVDDMTLQFFIGFNEMLMKHISVSVNEGLIELPPLDKCLAELQKKSRYNL